MSPSDLLALLLHNPVLACTSIRQSVILAQEALVATLSSLVQQVDLLCETAEALP